jgi:hypothetical protein
LLKERCGAILVQHLHNQVHNMNQIEMVDFKLETLEI